MGLNFWQRRYVLQHYLKYDDETLAAGSGVPVARVAGYRQAQGASRSARDERRISAAGPQLPPTMFTPGNARGVLTKLQSRPLTRLDALLIGVLFLGSVVLYALTCAITVTGEDAGELLAAAHGFGVPHPPGYPLWLLLAWAADHAVSFGTVAWRVAMVSALCSAAANALLLAIALKTLRSRVAAFTASALFAVSLTHWTQAVIPEVYGLNTLFVALCLLLLIRLAEWPSAPRLIALATSVGMACTNHTSAFPVGGLFAVAALLIAPRLFRRPPVVAGVLMAGLLPLALFLVLPLASAREPYVDWGNPETLDALWQHVGRQQYAEVQAQQQALGGQQAYLMRLAILGEWATKQFGSLQVLLLAVLGIGTLFLRQTGLWLLLLALGWLSSVGVTRYAAFPFEREHVYATQIFWIPAWLTLAWFTGGGLDALVAALGRLLTRLPGLAVASVACVAIVAWPAGAHYGRADRSRTTLLDHYGRALLDVMEPGALYFPSSDHSTFTVLYQQGVLGYRTDVVVADKYGRLDESLVLPLLDEVERAIRQDIPPNSRRAFDESVLIRKWPAAVYFANRRDAQDLPGRTLEPVGPLYQVMTSEQAEAWWTPGAEGTPGLLLWEPLLPLLEADARQRLDFTVQLVHAELLAIHGFALLRAGDFDGAQASWDRIAGDLAPLKQTFNNIGAALAQAKRSDLALEFFDRARQEDPGYLLALRNEAFLRRERGERPIAIGLLRQAVEIAPDDRGLRLELAHQLEDEGELLAALAEYETLAASDEGDPTPWRDAGRLLERNGDLVKAQEAYAESLRLDPQQEDLATRLHVLQHGPVAPVQPWPMAEISEDHGHAAHVAQPPGSPHFPADPAHASFDPWHPAVSIGQN